MMRNPSAAAEGSSNSNNRKKKKKTSSTSGTSSAAPSPTPLKRGPWTPEEDQVLAEYIRKEGEGRWRTLPKRAGLLRCGKSCRLRWMNYLRPSVKRGQIAPDEEDLILRLHRLLGNRWSLIAGRIPGRTDNEIKNYWNTHLSKKLISQGIDPRTHKPLNPPFPSSSTTSPSTHKKPAKPNHPRPPPIITRHHQTPSTHHHHHPLPNPDHLIMVNQENNALLDPKITTDDHFDLDQYQEAQAAGNIVTNNGYHHAAYDNLYPADSDVSAVGLIRSDNLLTTNNEDDDDINYCSDDVFSSFLNSLINEDAFAAQHHLQPQPPDGHNDIIAPPSDHHDPVISITTASAPPAYGLGVALESPLMSSTFSQNDPARVEDHDE